MRRSPEPDGGREPQLAYSELQTKTRDEERRRRKARKITGVLQHFLGRSDLPGLTAIDIGSSTGFTVEAIARAGATVTRFDIDEPGIAFAEERFGDLATFAVAAGSAYSDASRALYSEEAMGAALAALLDLSPGPSS